MSPPRQKSSLSRAENFRDFLTSRCQDLLERCYAKDLQSILRTRSQKPHNQSETQSETTDTTTIETQTTNSESEMIIEGLILNEVDELVSKKEQNTEANESSETSRVYPLI